MQPSTSYGLVGTGPQAQERKTELLDQIVSEQAQMATRYLPVLSIDQAIERRDAIQKLKNLVLTKDVDYGIIPGTDKPTLLKPGAEKINSFFGYVPRYDVLAGSIEDWNGQLYGEPLFYYHVVCTLEKDGKPVGAGTGSCSSWERKYRYRASKRLCPECGAASLIKGKAEWEKGDYKIRGSFICFEKKGGCGAKFYGDDPAILNQPLGEVANPDVADIVNTVQKMADKRAYVAATLSATGASQWFTQDVEDLPHEAPAPAPPQPQGATEAAPPAPPSESKDWKKNFVIAMDKQAMRLGRPLYARLLGAHGFEDSDEIHDQKIAKKIYLEISKVPVPEPEPEPEKITDADLPEGMFEEPAS